MFLRTPSGREVPAQASNLHNLHAFDEDLRESLGLTSLYNVALGTTTELRACPRARTRLAAKEVRPHSPRLPKFLDEVSSELRVGDPEREHSSSAPW